MKRLTGLFLAALLVFSLAAFAQTGVSPVQAAGAASAPVAPPTKVGVINIQAAILGTNEGRRDFDALGKKFEPKQVELQNLNKEVDELRKQLSTQGDKLNDDARASLTKQLDSKQKTLQRSAEDAQNDFQGQQGEIAQRILQKMAPVIEKFARENGFAMLLDSSQVWPQSPLLLASASVDITEQIVNVYNAQSGVAPPPAGAARPTAPGAAGARPTTTPAGGAAAAAPKPAAPKPATPQTAPPK